MQRTDSGQARVWSAGFCGKVISKSSVVCFSAFLLLWAAAMLEAWIPAARVVWGRWALDWVFLVGIVTLAVSLARELPVQNVVFVCAILLFSGGGLELLNREIGVPFGAKRVTNAIRGGDPLLVAPLVWTTALLTSRGVARLVMRPFRDSGLYGFWLLGVASLLAVLFKMTVEPFASGTQDLWHWEAGKLAWTWYGTPWVTFFGWGASVLLTLILITPLLINKSPIRQAPGPLPFWVWLLFKILFASSALAESRSAAFLAGSTEIVLVSCLIGFGSRFGRTKR